MSTRINQANIFVKECILTALCKLILENNIPFSEITITQIIEKAGVNRSSYYRNYKSKEDIFVTFTNDARREMKQELDALRSSNLADYTPYINTYDISLLTFNYFKRYAFYLKGLVKANSSILLDFLNDHILVTNPDKNADEQNRYILYAFSGALFNVAIQWISDDCITPPETMAQIMIDLFHD